MADGGKFQFTWRVVLLRDSEHVHQRKSDLGIVCRLSGDLCLGRFNSWEIARAANIDTGRGVSVNACDERCLPFYNPLAFFVCGWHVSSMMLARDFVGNGGNKFGKRN